MTEAASTPYADPDSTTLDGVRALIHAQYDVECDALQPEAALADFGLDSLSVAELIFAVEDRFGIDYPAERTDVRTLGELVAVVDDALAAQGAAAGGAAAAPKPVEAVA